MDAAARRPTRIALLVAATGTMAAALWLLVGLAPDAHAATLTPNSTFDGPDIAPGDGLCATATPGQCTLRAAIMEANAAPGADVIDLTAGQTYTVGLGWFPEKPSGAHDFRRDLDITDALTIQGNGATIDGIRFDRVLQVHKVTVTLSDITVTGGFLTGERGSGAGIHLNGGHLTLERVSVIDNLGFNGGGIYNIGGTLVVRDSTISGNSSTSWGAGLYLLGGHTTVTNSTIDSNIAGFRGGGVLIQQGFFGSGSVRIINSTVSNNAASFTSAIHRNSGTVTLTGTVVSSTGQDCGGTIVSAGYNVGSDGSCGLTQPTDKPNTASGLGPLAGNGGPTMTRLPLAGSPVLDMIPNGTAGCGTGLTAFDQRSQPRPSGGACDSGAVERQPTDP